jgi:hypothetical protein
MARAYNECRTEDRSGVPQQGGKSILSESQS